MTNSPAGNRANHEWKPVHPKRGWIIVFEEEHRLPSNRDRLGVRLRREFREPSPGRNDHPVAKIAVAIGDNVHTVGRQTYRPHGDVHSGLSTLVIQSTMFSWMCSTTHDLVAGAPFCCDTEVTTIARKVGHGPGTGYSGHPSTEGSPTAGAWPRSPHDRQISNRLAVVADPERQTGTGGVAGPERFRGLPGPGAEGPEERTRFVEAE